MTNPVGGFTKTIEPDITVDTAAYTANDVVGGELELPAAFRHPGASAILQSVVVIDEAAQDAVLEILLFDSDPSQTYTDQDAVPTLAADVENLVGRVAVAAADYSTVGGTSIATVKDLGRLLEAAKGATSLWAVIVTTGTPTYAAADDLRVLFGFLQD